MKNQVHGQSLSELQKKSYIQRLSLHELGDVVLRRLVRAQSAVEFVAQPGAGEVYIASFSGRAQNRNVTAYCVVEGPLTMAPTASSRLRAATELLVRVTSLRTRFGKLNLTPNILTLVCPAKINDAARSHISAALVGKHVQFFDEDNLISQIDADCPDVWNEITANVTPYLRSLAKLVDEQGVISRDTLDQIGLKTNVVGAADGSYVEVKLVRPTTRIEVIRGQRNERLEFEEVTGQQIAKVRGGRILILGDAGSGKSTLLVRMAYLMAKAGVTAKDSYQIPLRVRATELADNHQTAVLDVCFDAIRRLTNIPLQPFSDEDLIEGRVTLLVDGLDEVSSDLARNELMSRLEEVAAKYPRITLVITTRPYASIERIDGIEKYTRYRISPISFRDAERIIHKIRGRNFDPAPSLEALRRLDSQHGMDLNPLLVTVFGLLADAEKKDLPANISELFSKFTELMLGRWDSNKGISQQYQSVLKNDLLARFAFSLHGSRRTRFARSEFRSFAEMRLDEIDLTSNLDVVIEETLDRSGLFRGDKNSLEFRHHMIQEFFAGQGISDTEFIQGKIDDDWWRTPIVFWFGKRPSDISTLRKLAESIDTGTVEPGVAIGLALQTQYLSPIKERIEVWKWVVKFVANATESLTTQNSSEYPLIDFVVQYLGARDSVALNGIEKPAFGVVEWITSSDKGDRSSDLRLFWLVTGLIEIGQLDLVKEVLSKRPIVDEKLNAALYLGCQMVSTVRSVPDGVRAIARELCQLLDARSVSPRAELTREFKGKLLELRRGKIVALDDDVEL